MTKGSPDSQHELMVTGLAHCLKQASPSAKLSFGTKIDLGLKPDLFVTHPDGQCWAYEMINKNADIRRVESKHQQYEQAGVQVYWLLWENLAPGKSLDAAKVTTQMVWANEEMMQGPRRYRFNQLQHTLARLGDGRLYVFTLDKPLLDQVEHWMFRLLLIGLHTFRCSLDQLHADWVEGQWDFIPLLYLVFSPQGQPQLKPGAGEISPAVAAVVESLIQFSPDQPILLSAALKKMDKVFSSTNDLRALMQQGLEAALAQRVPPYSEAEVQDAMERVRSTIAEMQMRRVMSDPDPWHGLQVMSEYIDNLPPLFRDAFREAIPVPTEEAMRQIFELKHWLEEDPHLQELLANL